jgi:hypothetical protein
MSSEFRLYPEERHWWSFNDYRAVLGEVQKLKAPRVLEFGPGSSTLALIEGGAVHIDTCEDDPDWAQVYRERLVDAVPKFQKDFPALEGIALHDYEWKPGLVIKDLTNATFDFALIDGPRGSLKRDAPLRFAIKRAPVVMFMDAVDSEVRGFIEKIAKRARAAVEYRDVGPLSVTAAILTR